MAAESDNSFLSLKFFVLSKSFLKKRNWCSWVVDAAGPVPGFSVIPFHNQHLRALWDFCNVNLCINVTFNKKQPSLNPDKDKWYCILLMLIVPKFYKSMKIIGYQAGKVAIETFSEKVSNPARYVTADFEILWIWILVLQKLGTI